MRSSAPRSVRATAVQAASLLFDLQASVDRVAERTARAAADGARLAVFAEVFVGGHPMRADFGARVGTRSREGREWFTRHHDSRTARAAVGFTSHAEGRLPPDRRTHPTDDHALEAPE